MSRAPIDLLAASKRRRRRAAAARSWADRREIVRCALVDLGAGIHALLGIDQSRADLVEALVPPPDAGDPAPGAASPGGPGGEGLPAPRRPRRIRRRRARCAGPRLVRVK